MVGVTQSRGFVRDAITAMKKVNPDSTGLIGELYAELAFFEMTLADNYCNGIPLGHTIDGVSTNGAPVTILQVYDSASAHLDTALALSAKSVRCGQRLRQSHGADLEGTSADRPRTSTLEAAACVSVGFGADDVRLRHDLLVGQRREWHVGPQQLHRSHQRCRQLRRHRRRQ